MLVGLSLSPTHYCIQAISLLPLAFSLVLTRSHSHFLSCTHSNIHTQTLAHRLTIPVTRIVELVWLSLPADTHLPPATSNDADLPTCRLVDLPIFQSLWFSSALWCFETCSDLKTFGFCESTIPLALDRISNGCLQSRRDVMENTHVASTNWTGLSAYVSWNKSSSPVHTFWVENLLRNFVRICTQFWFRQFWSLNHLFAFPARWLPNWNWRFSSLHL